MNYLKLSAIALVLLCFHQAEAQTYEIGHATRTFIDNSRGGREILTEIYYPATVAGESVPVANPIDGPFPVIVFAHGFVIRWDAYDYLWQELVPEGYIMLFPRTEGQLLPAPDHQAFADDMNFLANRVQVLRSSPGSPVYNKAADRTALMGHSMGGGATYLAAANNPFISATVTWAAAETSPSAIAAAADVIVPSLVIAGAEDCVSPTTSDQVPMYNALQNSSTGDCKTYVELTGGSHCNFTNGSATLCYTAEGFPCLFYGPFISRADQNSRTLAIMQPWLEAFLKNDCPAYGNFQATLATGQSNGELSFVEDCPLPCFASPLEDRLSGVETASADWLLPNSSIRLFPNPAAGQSLLQVYLAAGKMGQLELALFDLNGKQHWSRTVEANAGNNSIQLEFAGLSAGFYILRTSGAISSQQTLVLK